MSLWTRDDYTVTRLVENSVYKVEVEINGEVHEWKFYTKLTPYYTTRKKVRSTFPNILKVVDDSSIDILIYENSKYVDEALAEVEDEESLPSGSLIEQYVRAKTQLDLMTDLLFEISMQAGASEKNLGELKIAYEIKTPQLESILPLLQNKVKDLEKRLFADSNQIARPAIRAGQSEYPLNARVDF